MEFIRGGRIAFFSKSFWWIFTLTFLLYGFSNRFSLFYYAIPWGYFIIYFLTKKECKISSKALILYIFIFIFSLLVGLGGIYALDYQFRVKTSIYILFFLFPICLVFYSEIVSHPLKVIYRNLLWSYIFISLLLFFLYFNGFLAENRYQHVGNCLAATALLSLGLKSKPTKWGVFMLWLLMVLIVGSRQALVGLIFVGLVHAIITSFKTFLGFTILTFAIYLGRESILAFIEGASAKYELNTIKRVVIAINNSGGNSVNNRLKIYSDLINEVRFFPNLEFSPNHDFALPHNFFLEYFICCGFFLGLLFFIYILFLIVISLCKKTDTTLVYFSLFYFISFNVSTGVGAAKYFIYYCFLLIVIREKKKEYDENTIG